MTRPHEPETLLAHFAWVRGLARTLVRDSNLADDVAQQTMLAALEHPPRPELHVTRWLAAVARNVARQFHRGDSRRGPRETLAARPDHAPSTAELVERTMLQKEIVASVLRLEEPYRRAVLLHFFEGLSPREIADLEGAPVATIHTRLARALAHLRGRLDQQYGTRACWVVAAAAFLPRPTPFLLSSAGAQIVNAKIIAASVAAAAVALSVLLWQMQSPAEPAGAAADAAAARSSAKPAVAAAAPRETPAEPRPADSASRTAVTAATNTKNTPAPSTTRPAAAPAALRGKVIDWDARAIRGIGVRFVAAGAGKAQRNAQPAEPRDETQQNPQPAAAQGQTQQYAVVFTDDSGTFEIAAPSQGGKLEVVSDRYITVLEGYATEGVTRTETILIVAPKIGIAGFAVNEAGNPVAEAENTLVLPDNFRARFLEVLDASSPREWHALSDASGRFEFREIPQITGVLLETFAPGYQRSRIALAGVADFNVRVTLRKLDADAKSIAGIVVDGADRPVAHALIGFGDNGIATSGSDGRFVLSCGAPRAITLRVAKAGYEPISLDVKPMTIDGAPAWPGSLTLRLANPSTEIAGRVLDASGNPIANSEVWIDGALWLGLDRDMPLVAEAIAGDSGTAPVTQTDSQGKFKIKGLSQKTYKVLATDPKTLSLASADVAAGNRNAEIRVFSKDLHEKIAGTLVDTRGNPVAGAEMTANRGGFEIRMTSGRYSSGGTQLPAVVTDAAGRFQFNKVAKDGIMIFANAAHIMPDAININKTTDVENLVFRVSLRCHCKIELENPAEADSFQVFDQNGKRLTISMFSGESSWGSDTGELRNGKTSMLALDETARTLVLLLKGKEVRRVPIELKPGEPNILRP